MVRGYWLRLWNSTVVSKDPNNGQCSNTNNTQKTATWNNKLILFNHDFNNREIFNHLEIHLVFLYLSFFNSYLLLVYIHLLFAYLLIVGFYVCFLFVLYYVADFNICVQHFEALHKAHYKCSFILVINYCQTIVIRKMTFLAKYLLYQIFIL